MYGATRSICLRERLREHDKTNPWPTVPSRRLAVWAAHQVSRLEEGPMIYPDKITLGVLVLAVIIYLTRGLWALPFWAIGKSIEIAVKFLWKGRP